MAQLDDGQMGDNINRMKVCRFESCQDYKKFKTKIMKQVLDKTEAIYYVDSSDLISFIEANSDME